MISQDRHCKRITDTAEELYPNCLIIECPQMKSNSRVLLETIITILLWAYWFFLWLPLLLISIERINPMSSGGESKIDIAILFYQIKFLSFGLSLIAGGIAGWIFYNVKRYSGICDLGKNIVETDAHKLADYLSVSGEKLKKIQQSKYIVFSFFQDDSIKNVSLDPIPSPKQIAALKK